MPLTSTSKVPCLKLCRHLYDLQVPPPITTPTDWLLAKAPARTGFFQNSWPGQRVAALRGVSAHCGHSSQTEFPLPVSELLTA